METHQPKYCYLKSKTGEMVDPLLPSFPKTLKECGNNPYRSLVDLLSDEELIKEGSIPYYEFYVAEILQSKGYTLPNGEIKHHEWKEYIKKAKKIIEKDDVKAALKKLVIKCAAVSKGVQANLSNEKLKTLITDAHDVFHTIVGECRRTEE